MKIAYKASIRYDPGSNRYQWMVRRSVWLPHQPRVDGPDGFWALRTSPHTEHFLDSDFRYGSFYRQKSPRKLHKFLRSIAEEMAALERKKGYVEEFDFEITL